MKIILNSGFAGAGLLAILAALQGACGSDSGGSGGPDGGPDSKVSCAYTKTVPEIVLPESRTEGVLKGKSQNESTSCTRQSGTLGPDKVYFIRLTERRIVELQVVSDFDTVIAIRRTCDDPLTEAACSDFPIGAGNPGGPKDPGVGARGGFDEGGAGGSSGGGSGTSTPMTQPAGPGTFAQTVDEKPSGDVAFPSQFLPGSGGSGGGSLTDNPLDGGVRVLLNPGVYYVIIDEAEPFGVGGPFSILASSFAPPANSACATPTAVSNGIILPNEQLAFAGALPPDCQIETPRPSLFYSATIPSGERLTVRATATGGERQWNPAMQLFDSCTATGCLGTDQPGSMGERVLQYVNNGPSPLTVLFSVSSDTAVSGATFQLSIRVAAPQLNASCAAATKLMDGTILKGQDVAEGGDLFASNCTPPGKTLYYQTILEPQQTIQLTTILQPPVFAPIFLSILSSCGNNQCLSSVQSDRLNFTNVGATPMPIIIQATTPQGNPGAIFDLMVSMTLPPGGISVSPTRGLDVAESGTSQTFDVVLTARPLDLVIIPIESGDTTEVTVSPASLTFSPLDWNKPQKVRLTGVDDGDKDGTQTVTIFTRAATAKDQRYQGFDADDVVVRNRDDEPGVTITPVEPFETSEWGSTATFTLELNKQPSLEVTVPVSSSDTTEGTVSTTLVVIAAADWNKPVLVTVTGVDDDVQDGVQSYNIVLGALVSADPAYATLDPADIPVRNRDNEIVEVAPHVIGQIGTCAPASARMPPFAVDDAGTIHIALLCRGADNAGGNPGMGGSTGGAGGAGGQGGTGGRVSSGGSTGSAGSPGGTGILSSGGAPAPAPPPAGGSIGSGGGVGTTSGVFITSSTDGGQTFGPLKPTGIIDARDLAIAAGVAGSASILAATTTGVKHVFTANHGGTWSQPTMVASSPFAIVFLTARRERLVAAVLGEGSVVLSNRSAGRGVWTQTAADNLPQPFAMGIAEDIDTVFVLTGDQQIRKSVGSSLIFGAGVPLSNPLKWQTSAFGVNQFALGDGRNGVWIVAADTGQGRFVTSTQIVANAGISADPTGAFVLIQPFNGNLTAVRLAKDAAAFSAPIVLATDINFGMGVAYFDRGVAFLATNFQNELIFGLKKF